MSFIRKRPFIEHPCENRPMTCYSDSSFNLFVYQNPPRILVIMIMIMIIIIFISGGSHSQTQDFIFTVALRFKVYTFHASGLRVEFFSSRYSFLNYERDGV